MSNKKSFVLYADYAEQFELLDMAERGELITAIFSYHNSGIVPKFESGMKMLFSIIKNQLDRDSVKYEAVCKRNRENGEKGGRPPNERKSEVKPEVKPEAQLSPELEALQALKTEKLRLMEQARNN